jgi:hypothetical protein
MSSTKHLDVAMRMIDGVRAECAGDAADAIETALDSTDPFTRLRELVAELRASSGKGAAPSPKLFPDLVSQVRSRLGRASCWITTEHDV